MARIYLLFGIKSFAKPKGHPDQRTIGGFRTYECYPSDYSVWRPDSIFHAGRYTETGTWPISGYRDSKRKPVHRLVIFSKQNCARLMISTGASSLISYFSSRKLSNTPAPGYCCHANSTSSSSLLKLFAATRYPRSRTFL